MGTAHAVQQSARWSGSSGSGGSGGGAWLQGCRCRPNRCADLPIEAAMLYVSGMLQQRQRPETLSPKLT